MWVDVLPFNREEVARLVTRRDRIEAMQVLAGPTNEPVDYQFANRLCFVRFLVRTGVLSEWKECRDGLS